VPLCVRGPTICWGSNGRTMHENFGAVGVLFRLLSVSNSGGTNGQTNMRHGWALSLTLERQAGIAAADALTGQ
jgi:hypothetical protein